MSTATLAMAGNRLRIGTLTKLYCFEGMDVLVNTSRTMPAIGSDRRVESASAADRRASRL